jgi:DNA-directed RNA polymerase specialized sigma24 family protein
MNQIPPRPPDSDDDTSSGTPQTDAQLLARFANVRDEAAFAELVRRHGPMVLSVCQRLLGHYQDAENATQETFLVLALRAGSVPWKESISGWLYRVAFLKALKARRAPKSSAVGSAVPEPKPTDDATTGVETETIYRGPAPGECLEFEEELVKCLSGVVATFIAMAPGRRRRIVVLKCVAILLWTVQCHYERAGELADEVIARLGLNVETAKEMKALLASKNLPPRLDMARRRGRRSTWPAFMASLCNACVSRGFVPI